jgi:signal transduction histidine kinase/streptogramin lyase
MFAIAQTSDGFLWFSGQGQGLYRFDGVQFLPRTVAFNGKPINPLVNVHGDRAGGLWAMGENEIVHLKNGAMTSHFALQTLWGPNTVTEGPDGSLWVVRIVDREDSDPLCRVTDGEVKCFGTPDGMATILGGSALVGDGGGGFWLGGRTSVIHWHQGVSQTYSIGALKSNTGQGVNALALGADGTLWVGLLPQGPGLGLGRLVNGVFQSFVVPGFDGNKVAVQSMTFDREGNLWVGTLGDGLFRIRGNVVEHYGRKEGLSSDSVNDLFEDKEGILWAATTNGIDSFRDPRIVTFSAAEGLGLDLVVGVLASRDGGVWVADGDSLGHIDKNGTVSSIRWGKGLPGDQVSSMLEDRAGNLWVGVYDGLYTFKNGHFRRIPEPDHQPLGLVFGIAEDANGDIWATSAGKLRKQLRIRNFRVYEQSPEFARHLTTDAQGGIWGLNGMDLVRLRGSSFEKFPLNVSNTEMHQVVPQTDGSVLVASPEGLLGQRQGKVQRMGKKNGLPCDWVSSAVEDQQKHWWLFTDCGVVEFADSELQRWWADPEAVVETRVFDTLDGVRPGRPIFDPAALSADGRVWFATGSVLQMVDPSVLSQKAPPAQTYIESVTVDRKEFAASNTLRVAPHPRDLQIDYTAPTFAIPQKVRFRYRLDPYDRAWNDAGTRRQAFYTDLPPGKYSFRVIASNSDGVWNENAAKLDFSVAPAYYQSKWFRALGALALLTLLWAMYQWRVRQLAAQFNMRLEERVSERTRIARDLHDTLLQSFQGLLPRFQAAIYKLPEHPVDARETLEAAVDQASQAITEGRDAVQGLRASTVEKNDLAMAIRGVAEELASADTNQSSPAFQVAVQGVPRNLHPILRDEVYRIAAEALRNAFRHAQAGRIEVELRYDAKDFTLRIRDDGRGINRDVLSGDGREGHYGLHGMRERAKLVGGELAIWSEVDSGTEVELSIPASRAYIKPSKPSRLFQRLSKRNTDWKERIKS